MASDSGLKLDPRVQGALDIVGHMAKAAGVQSLSGIKGISELLQGHGMDAAADAVNNYQKQYSPHDLSPEGISDLRAAAPAYYGAAHSAPAKWLSDHVYTPGDYSAGVQKWSDLAGKYLGPTAAGVMGAVGEAAPMAFFPEADVAKVGAESIAKSAPELLSEYEAPRAYDGSSMHSLENEHYAANQARNGGVTTSVSKATDPGIGHPTAGLIGYHPDAMVVDTHDSADGRHIGRLVFEPTKDGTAMQGRRSDVWDEADRGKGYGPQMLKTAIDTAHGMGLDWHSDTKLAPAQVKGYMKLQEQGYPIEFNPTSSMTEDGHLTSGDNNPVLKVTQPTHPDTATPDEEPSALASGWVKNQAGEDQPLTPPSWGGTPSEHIRSVARQYMADAGLPYNPPQGFVAQNPATGKAIAAAYDAMPHAPTDPRVAASYEALKRETMAQYQAAKANGFQAEFIPPGAPDPYGNPRNATKDIQENNHMWVYPTESGFGSGQDMDLSAHPMLEQSGESFNGVPATHNDIFRAVHDYFGHAKEGNGFRANGEENAWLQHAHMYSPDARPAMTTETRGQNSWVNSGPHADANRGASGADTVYAPQKVGLLPDEFNDPEASYPQDPQAYAEGGEVGAVVGGIGDLMAKYAPEAKIAAQYPDKPQAADNLKQWFGNSVAHTNGTPDVYYTGTSKDKDFSSFNVGRHGVWFTKDPADASSYALNNDSQGSTYQGGRFVPTNTSSRMIPAYLKVENPYTGRLPDALRTATNYKAAQSNFFDQLRAAGHDGWMPQDVPGLVAVLKDPTQIKSAVGNSGDFAPAAKGMNKADGGPARFADGGEAGMLLGGLGEMMREYAPEANDLAAHVAEKGGVTYSPVTGDLHQAGTVTATDPSRTVALDSAPHAQEIHDFLMQNQDVLGEDPAAVLHITSDDQGNHFLHVAKHTPQIPEIGAEPVAANPQDLAPASIITRTSNPASFQELSERYPLQVPGEMATDKKTGKQFLQKVLSPEAQAVSKARVAAQADINAGNYEPYFDVNKRFDVDNSQYPQSTDTLAITPKKEATIAKYQAQATTPDAIARLDAAYNNGLPLEGSQNWYHMGQLEAKYKQVYGPEIGPQMFRSHFADAMAATTGGADPTSNLMMAHYGNYLKGQGLAAPSAAHEMPFPIGGRYASGNMDMYNKIMNEGSQMGANSPKRTNFSANFQGHPDRATIDEQMSGLFDPKMAAPAPGTYGVYEQALHDLAAKHGVDPRFYQEVAWAGAKKASTPNYTPKPMIQIVNEAIERTHRITGMDHDSIVDGMVRGKIPLYGHGGSVGDDAPEDVVSV